MLTRAMAKELSAASAHECLFVEFLFEEEPKKVPKKHSQSWKSTSGAYQLLGGKLVCWSAKKQHSVAMSSAKAEYVAVCSALKNKVMIPDITLIKIHVLKGTIDYISFPLYYNYTDIFHQASDDLNFKMIIVE
ncbi:hypothetical protein Tco_0986769 [Tanacetum coccineum]